MQSQEQEQTTSVSFHWGNVVLTLNDPNFRYGFFRGRDSYRNECEEEPRREIELVASDFLKLIALPDVKKRPLSL